MKKVYTTANGKQVNLDALIAENEKTIAVGNMKVNARGDKLGPGGKVEQTKEQVMKEYYKLNTPVAVDAPQQPHQTRKIKDLDDDWVEPAVDSELDKNNLDTESKTKLRGKLADSVSQTKLAEPVQPKKTGPSRI
jgi:hypothetical protein